MIFRSIITLILATAGSVMAADISIPAGAVAKGTLLNGVELAAGETGQVLVSINRLEVPTSGKDGAESAFLARIICDVKQVPGVGRVTVTARKMVYVLPSGQVVEVDIKAYGVGADGISGTSADMKLNIDVAVGAGAAGSANFDLAKIMASSKPTVLVPSGAPVSVVFSEGCVLAIKQN